MSTLDRRAAEPALLDPFRPDVPIRQATVADIPEICDLLRGMHGEVAFAPLSEAKMQTAVTDAVTGGMVLVTIDSDGVPVGTCALLVGEHWYSEHRFLSDLWFYVAPRHRRTPHARTLLLGAKYYAEAIKMPLILGVLGPSGRIKAKSRLYQRVFGEPIGVTFGVGIG